MKHLNHRLLSLVLAICMLVSLAAPAAAAPAGKVTFTKVDNSTVTADLLTKAGDDLKTMEQYVDTDVVRVSIFLEDQSTIMAGYSVDSIASNSQAMAYRAGLKDKQAEITAAIEKALGAELDVVWNLTLAANLISANVRYGQIEAIEQVAGVSQVLIETQYAPDVVKAEEVSDPSMSTSSAQIGSAAAWAAGYTGAGSRIAVIDTGADTDHQSLSADAFQYSLAFLAGKNGMTPEEYMEHLDLLDAEEIAAVADELNAPVAGEAYINSKIPFGYNYVDGDLDVTHDNDNQGSHGSHVSGIATANAYLLTDDGFVNSMETAMVQGVAPDAQLIAMKVFGKSGGAYDSDYMAAIEDAVILGCDAANLSLGSGNPGTSRNAKAEYQAIMESLTKAGIVVAMSAGNSGYWAANAYNVGYLYNTDVSMQTNGSPGSFTNSLSVASVDNDGLTGYYISVDGMMIVYNETAYSNAPFTSIAGEHEYVFIDGVGTAEDWAAVGEALSGKIALCSRGETSFFEKAQLAVEAGAIATFIYNNAAGVINMDLTDYPYEQPVASLTLEDGNAIRAASTPVTDEAGNVLYYTGTMTVSDSLGSGQFNSDYYTMSSFSSWGVPGSLELKPEITAPGGSIYSINGVDTSGTAYEVMSGTSMASPQVAGMAALVAQYIRENDLEAQTGLTARQLAQSLLMSTAEPMLASADSYYPVIQQGAGLANVGAAISADSYITMADGMNAGAADGKVKVELGDDPDKTGSYTATFTINNLTWDEKAFDLSADFFIQAPISDGVNLYMYTSTALIGADVTWSVDGGEIEPADMDGLDFNGDGIVNSDDGQAILEYATGISELVNMDKADLDADGDVDSYDAYLFLSQLSSGTAVVPAFGSAEVTVNFSLSDDWKAALDLYYPNGTYIQGYLYAESLTDAEGVAGTCHSIPVLGFFGNWTDPSMIDVGSRPEYLSGEETRIPYLGSANINTYVVNYAALGSAGYYFGGNPVIPDSTYMPERNAINSVNGDFISTVQMGVIRNAAASRFTAVNKTTGEVCMDTMQGQIYSAYYHVNSAVWQNVYTQKKVNFDPSSANEGDVLELTFTLAPEYYVDAEGNVDWDALGEGASFSTVMVVDNTAPVLKDVAISLMKNTLDVTVSDNQYVSAVTLYNKRGNEILAEAGAMQEIAPNETATFSLDITGLSGSSFLLQVTDYAMNTTTYMIDTQIGEEPELPEMIAFDMDWDYWTSFTKDSDFDELGVYAGSATTFCAATIVDHMVIAADIYGDLYIMPETDLEDTTLICNTGAVITDMAYNKADGNVYGVTEGVLVRIDKLTGELTVVGEIGVMTNTLACDAAGTFYCNGYNTGNVYSFTLDTLDAPVIVVENIECDGEPLATSYIQTMEINPNNGMLCWNSYYGISYGSWVLSYAYYIEIDPATGAYTVYNDLWDELAALIIPEKSSDGGSWTDPVTQATGIQISDTELNMLKGGNAALTATVTPWTAIDRTVTWTSSDESVAVVDAKGVVTAVSEGTAVITAVSNLTSELSASCIVNVESLDITIAGTLQDAEGNSMFYTWNMETDDTWTGGNAIDTSMTSATYDAADDAYYIMDAVSDSWSMHKVTPDGTSVKIGANGAGVPLWDMAYSDYFAEVKGTPMINSIYYYYYLAPKDPMNLDTSAFSLSSYASYLTAIASMGYEEYVDNEGNVYDTEHIVLLTAEGYVIHFWVYATETGYSAFLGRYHTDLPCAFPGDDSGENMYTSMVVGDDNNLYVSAFNGETNELFRLVYDDHEMMYLSDRLGDVGQDVWPATITSVTTNASAAPEAAAFPAATDHIDAVTVSAEELAAVSMDNRAASLTMTAEAKAAKAQLMGAQSGVADDETTVTIDVTADELTTNGVMEITWDTDALELVEIFDVSANTVIAEDEGAVTYGYVSLTPIAAGETIVSLTFNVKKTETTTVTVNQKQVNNTTGTSEDIVVEFTHANTEVRDAVAATCTEAGYTGDTYCADCGKLISTGEIIEALGHSYEAVVTDPTCTEGGCTTYTCSTCGDSYIADHTDPDCASAAFVDVNVGEWFHEAVDYVVEAGLMNGVAETAFAPAAAMNRAQMVTVLYRMAGSPDVTAPAAFTDIPADSFYTDAVAWAVEQGITSGVGAGKFNPTGEVSREQMVTFLYRYVKSTGADMTVSSDLSAFEDAAAVSDWAVEAMTWAVEKGIISGVTETTLTPTASANRATVATVLMRMAN